MLDTQSNINHHTKEMLEVELFGKKVQSSKSPPSLELVINKSLSSSDHDAVTHEVKLQSIIHINLNKPIPLDPKSFPHQPSLGSHNIPATIENTNHLLSAYSIKVSYNTIKKKLLIILPKAKFSMDNADNSALATITSLAILNNMAIGQIPSFLEVIGDNNRFNPVASWIKSATWDGVDRLGEFYDTLKTEPDYAITLKRKLMYRWMLSAVAAALKPNGFKARGVLTLQGPQGIGKTSWISSLLTGDIVNEDVLKLDHHLDAGNKDSIITAVSHWIVEIGELDSSFKKDIARLKGFLTADQDKMRRPYGKSDSTYPRRTVFCATVNEHNFLVDPTGNSRWWTIPVLKVDYQHGINMQQLFAQLAEDFHAGKQWWLTSEEESLLEQHNKTHQAVSVIRERVLIGMDLRRIGHSGLKPYTASQILIKLGIDRPTNTQARDCGAILREVLGDPKKIQGAMTWRFPFKCESVQKIFTVSLTDDDDGY